MKTKIILICIVLLSSPALAQTTFSKCIKNTNNEFPTTAIEMKNGNYLISYGSIPPNQENFNQKFIVLDTNGLEITTAKIIDLEGSCLISNLHQVNDSLILAIGTYGYTGKNLDIWIIGMDPLLSTKWEKKFKTNYPFYFFNRSIINSDNNIVIASTLANGSTYNCLFFEITENGDSLYSKYLNQPVGHPVVFDILEIKNEKKYRLASTGFTSTTNSMGQILTIDSLFNLIQIDAIPANMYNCTTLTNDTDTTYFLSGNYDDLNSNERDIAIMRLDENNDKLAITFFGKPGNIIDFGGYEQSMDYNTKSDIYVGGTSNQDISPINNIYSSSKSWFILSSYDSLLNLHWTRFYGGDAYYTLEGVQATSDNGCIMYGNRYDYLTQEMEKDILIIKVDEQGLYTGIGEPQVKINDAILYPNPGREQLNIQSGPQINGAAFTLYDMQGRPLLNQTLNSTQLKLNTATLPSGIYPWQIVFKNNVIESGKWIKE